MHLIEKHENGWAYIDNHDLAHDSWYLVYTDDKVIAHFLQSEQSISTSVNLFVGSKEECEQHILDNDLAYEVMPEDPPYETGEEV
jgi:hypothetical protein